MSDVLSSGLFLPKSPFLILETYWNLSYQDNKSPFRSFTSVCPSVHIYYEGTLTINPPSRTTSLRRTSQAESKLEAPMKKQMLINTKSLSRDRKWAIHWQGLLTLANDAVKEKSPVSISELLHLLFTTLQLLVCLKMIRMLTHYFFCPLTGECLSSSCPAADNSRSDIYYTGMFLHWEQQSISDLRAAQRESIQRNVKLIYLNMDELLTSPSLNPLCCLCVCWKTMKRLKAPPSAQYFLFLSENGRNPPKTHPSFILEAEA